MTQTPDFTTLSHDAIDFPAVGFCGMETKSRKGHPHDLGAEKYGGITRNE